ncbi:hypothetical protein BDV93DRAFT_264467 [Ceratobasidium sp. AG-I]|nr:hypothetical protein BDV93DRAFT_264467 [Ceratobasidium sp. AG-I]
MQNLQPALQYLAPLDLYLDTPSLFSDPFPTLEQVKSAIYAFCPYNHETATMDTNKSSAASIHNLTRILYLSYYPSHFGLLNIPLFIPVCFYAIEDYLRRHKMFDRTFGLVMIKVITLATMVGVLVQKKQLDSLITSLGELHATTQQRKDYMPHLVSRVACVVQEEMQRGNGFARGFLLWTESHSVEIDGQLRREGFYTSARCKNLLGRLWEQRDRMLKTLERSPTPGLSVVLHIARSNALEDPTLDKNRTIEVLSQSQDLIVRYSLVDTPEEGATSQKYWPSTQHDHLAPIDAQDHRMITTLLARRLKSPGVGFHALSLHHAENLLLQFFNSVKQKKTYDLCIPILESAFEYLWREVSRQGIINQAGKEVLAYGISFLTVVTNCLIEVQRLSVAKSIGSPIFKILYEAEFVNLCAVLMLASPLQWAKPALRAVSRGEPNLEEAKTSRDGLKVIIEFINTLKYYPFFTRPLVEQSYRDWVKVFDFNCQSFAAADPNSLMYMYTELCIRVWSNLGEAFGYFQEFETRRSQMSCEYDRCVGSDNVQGVEQLGCGECVNIGYCSIRCQRADWPRHKTSHAGMHN